MMSSKKSTDEQRLDSAGAIQLLRKLAEEASAAADAFSAVAKSRHQLTLCDALSSIAGIAADAISRAADLEHSTDPSVIMRRISAERPKVSGEHYVRFRWPGPGTFKDKLSDVEVSHCHPMRQVSLHESCISDAVKAGFEYMGWASA